jgi:carbon monoxide dehydrogenase subunit G
MDFGGRYRVKAGRQDVWHALNNIEVLRACIPSAERIDWTGENSLELEIKVNLGIAKPTFKADLWLTGVVPAERYTLNGKGKGGVLGLAQGGAKISLKGDGDATELNFTAEGHASPRIMQFGSVLIGGRAQKVIDEFFARFGEAMGAEVIPLPRD